jgi:SulP family sulfate permease
VPESLAHAHLASLRPEVGLYSAIAAAFAYAVFGRSRFLVVGTDASLAILLAGTIGTLAGGDQRLAASMAAFVAIVAGAMGLVAWILRLGFLSNLMSKSVLAGFFAGAGLSIIVHQLPELLGIEAYGGSFAQQLQTLVGHLAEANWATLALGTTAFLLLVLGERLLPGKPVSLFVLALGAALSWALGLASLGVTHVGAGQHLPGLSLPLQALQHWKDLLPLSLAAFLVSYVASISTARRLAATHSEPVDPDRELLADGACNLAAGVLRGMPVAASLSRSFANEETARTRLSGVVSGLLIVVAVVFLRSYLGRLPHTILAATIIHHAMKQVDLRAVRQIYGLARREFATAVVTLLGVLLFGLLWGVIIGVVATLLDLLERANHPHTAVIGRDPVSGRYEDIQEIANCETVAGTLVLRIDVSIFAANAESIRREVMRRVRSLGGTIKLIVLDLEASPMMDVSGADMMDQMHESFRAEGIVLEIAEAKRAVRQLLMAQNPGKFARFPSTITEAINAGQGRPPHPA